LCQQRIGEVFENIIIEDSQTAVVRQTSVDCCEPVDPVSVNLVTRRVVHKSIVTARLCLRIKYAYTEYIIALFFTFIMITYTADDC